MSIRHTYDETNGLEWGNWHSGGCQGWDIPVMRQGFLPGVWPRHVVARMEATADVCLNLFDKDLPEGTTNIRIEIAERWDIKPGTHLFRGEVPGSRRAITPFLPE